MIDDYIKKLLEQAEQQEKWAANYMPDNYDDDYVSPKERRQHAEECRQLAERLTELKEAKRLLKLAVEDFSNVDYHIYECDMDCDSCPIHGERDNCVKWVHADEALKLIES